MNLDTITGDGTVTNKAIATNTGDSDDAAGTGTTASVDYSSDGTNITAVYTYAQVFTAIATAADGQHVVTAFNNGKFIFDSFTSGGVFLAGAKTDGSTSVCRAKDAAADAYTTADYATQLVSSTEASSYTATLPPPPSAAFTGVATLTTDVIGSASPYTATVSLGFSITMAAAFATSAEVEAFSCVNNSTTQYICGLLAVTKTATATSTPTEAMYVSAVAPAAAQFAADKKLAGAAAAGFVPTSGGTQVYAKVATLAPSAVADGTYVTASGLGNPTTKQASTWVPAAASVDKKLLIGGVAFSLAQTGSNKGEDSVEKIKGGIATMFAGSSHTASGSTSAAFASTAFAALTAATACATATAAATGASTVAAAGAAVAALALAF